MKKIILSMILGIMAITASAQIKTVDIKGNLRNDFGIGGGITIGLNDKIDFSPALNYFFVDGDGNCWTTDADFHYNFGIAQDFRVYPILGGTLCHPASGSTIKFGINLGCGCQYDFTESFAGFVDLKYQYVDGWDDTYFSLGVKIAL